MSKKEVIDMLRRRYFSGFDGEGEVLYEGSTRNTSDIIVDTGKEINIGGKYVLEFDAAIDYVNGPIGPMGSFLARFRMGTAHDFINCGIIHNTSWELLMDGTLYNINGHNSDISAGGKVIIKYVECLCTFYDI